MFCPNCGNQGARDQKFCRSCGMNLQKVATALIDHLAKPGSDQLSLETPAAVRSCARRNALWGMAITFTGIAYGVVGKLMIHEDIVTGAGALVAVIGMFWFAFVLLYAGLRPTPGARGLSQSVMTPDAKTTAQLTPERVPDIMPSVVERTTDLLADAQIQSAKGRHSDELRV
jgi:hypothetical protein